MNCANFRCVLPNLLGFKPNFTPIIANFLIFRKNLIEYPEFSVYSACKYAPLYVLKLKIPNIRGVRMNFQQNKRFV